MGRLTDALCALGEKLTGQPVSGDTAAEVIENIVAAYPEQTAAADTGDKSGE